MNKIKKHIMTQSFNNWVQEHKTVNNLSVNLEKSLKSWIKTVEVECGKAYSRATKRTDDLVDEISRMPSRINTDSFKSVNKEEIVSTSYKKNENRNKMSESYISTQKEGFELLKEIASQIPYVINFLIEKGVVTEEDMIKRLSNAEEAKVSTTVRPDFEKLDLLFEIFKGINLKNYKHLRDQVQTTKIIHNEERDDTGEVIYSHSTLHTNLPEQIIFKIERNVKIMEAGYNKLEKF